MEKPDRGNLHRIGAVHTLGDKTPVGLHEFIFTGDTPKKSASDFMLCTDGAVPDDPPPGKLANPGCQHWFALPELSSTVKISYRRRHLDQWRTIKDSVTKLLISWRTEREPSKP